MEEKAKVFYMTKYFISEEQFEQSKTMLLKLLKMSKDKSSSYLRLMDDVFGKSPNK